MKLQKREPLYINDLNLTMAEYKGITLIIGITTLFLLSIWLMG